VKTADKISPKLQKETIVTGDCHEAKYYKTAPAWQCMRCWQH